MTNKPSTPPPDEIFPHAPGNQSFLILKLKKTENREKIILNEALLKHVADSFVEGFLDSKLLLYCIEVRVTPHRYWDFLLRLTDACVTIWYVTTCYRVTQRTR